jgi:hypothetical protein
MIDVSAPTPLSPRRKTAFALTAISLVVGGAALSLLGLDVYLHHRVQNLSGVNVWGYRGDVIPRKQPGEVRIVVLGGSTAFGYGLPPTDSFPAFLEQNLNRERHGRPTFRVANLGAPGQGAFGFRFDLEDYAYMRYDLVILYEGYNDLGPQDIPDDVPHPYDPNTPARAPRAGLNELLWRRQSPVFRATGYMPVLPLVLREKAMAMLAGGDLDAAYRGRTVFRPGLATRATATALMSAAAIADSVGTQLGRLSAHTALDHPVDDAQRWRRYVENVTAAVAVARKRGAKALVVTQPYVSDAHVRQQRALALAVAEQSAHDRGIAYVNLGTVVDLRDRRIAYDGLHLVAEGNQAVAARLVEPTLQLLDAARP